MGALIWSRKSRREALSLSFTLLFFYSPSRECGGRTIPFEIPDLPLERCRESEKAATCIKSSGRSLFFFFLKF